MGKIIFATDQFYHLYNRGVERRNIFENRFDLERFLQSIRHFNTIEPIGSMYEQSFVKKSERSPKPIVRLVAYVLNPNHYHFILQPTIEKGVEKFIHRLATGYTNYFNEKYRRRGALFQGRYKSKHVDNNEYLLHLSAYINLNARAHQLPTTALTHSSWEEYVSPKNKPYENLCQTDIILEQFSGPASYREFAEESLVEIIKNKIDQHEEFLSFP